MTKVVNFGCRLNNFEGKKIEELIAQQDNIIVINSCAVTNETERQVRQTIRRSRKENPDAKLVMTGCAAQISPGDYKKMPEVDYVIDNINKLKQSTHDANSANKMKNKRWQIVKKDGDLIVKTSSQGVDEKNIKLKWEWHQ